MNLHEGSPLHGVLGGAVALARNMAHTLLMTQNDCPKCNGKMAEGFLLDLSASGPTQIKWVDGAPTPSFWTGINLKGHELIPVSTHRCTRCGFLESYAMPE